jgi:predicted GIY-YIG superfamily endonuclease
VLLFPAMREGRFYNFWIYIMASRTGTLYIGMTGFIDTRIFRHKSGEIEDSRRNISVIALFTMKNMTTCMWQSAANRN